MRTTLDIDTRLLDAARHRAAEKGTTLTALIEEALATLLTPAPCESSGFKLNVKTERGRYIGAVDLADRDRLYDILDQR